MFTTVVETVTRWCSGNTRDFGSLVPGSNPGWVVFLLLSVFVLKSDPERRRRLLRSRLTSGVCFQACLLSGEMYSLDAQHSVRTFTLKQI